MERQTIMDGKVAGGSALNLSVHVILISCIILAT